MWFTRNRWRCYYVLPPLIATITKGRHAAPLPVTRPDKTRAGGVVLSFKTAERVSVAVANVTRMRSGGEGSRTPVLEAICASFYMFSR